MKHLNNWKLFESKISDLVNKTAKSYDLDNPLEKLLPRIFILQFKEFLKEKFPDTFFQKWVGKNPNWEDEIRIHSFFPFSVGLGFGSFNRTGTNPCLYLEPTSLSGTISSTKLDSTIKVSEYFTTMIFEPTRLKLISRREFYRFGISPYNKLADQHQDDFAIFKNNISPDEKYGFKTEFFETIYKQTLAYFIDFQITLIEISIEQNLSDKLNLYYKQLKVDFPELLKSIAQQLELTPEKLNQIRSNLPDLYDIIKSLQKPEDQWSTDLQADAGEYGL